MAMNKQMRQAQDLITRLSCGSWCDVVTDQGKDNANSMIDC